jgi:hypothetical protein
MDLDSLSEALAAQAGSALGRMFFQAEKGKVGPIVLKRFETALAALDDARKT